MRPVRLTWTIGGVGLVLCGVIGMLRYSLLGVGPGVAVMLDVVFAAAVLVFAIGLSRRASVVARRPLGVIALAVVALWPVLVRIAQPLLPTTDAATLDAGLDAYRAAESLLTAVFFVNLLVSLSAALIAAVQIAPVDESSSVGAVVHH
jgi:phosphotransferase system  glucose/maltose/N-acetylglucosamine-specific IIC component